MAVFRDDEIATSRLDYVAILGGGLATIHVGDVDAARSWLAAQGYRVVTIDCAQGTAAVFRRIDEIFDWRNQFGYAYAEGRHGLDALNDGFQLDVPDAGGAVLELDRPDLLWEVDAAWTDGLLEIASEYSRRKMMEGKRFFTVLVVPPDSRLIGKPVGAFVVPIRERWRF